MRYWLPLVPFTGGALLLMSLLPALVSPGAMLLAGTLAAVTGMALCTAIDHVARARQSQSAQ